MSFKEEDKIKNKNIFFVALILSALCLCLVTAAQAASGIDKGINRVQVNGDSVLSGGTIKLLAGDTAEVRLFLGQDAEDYNITVDAHRSLLADAPQYGDQEVAVQLKAQPDSSGKGEVHFTLYNSGVRTEQFSLLFQAIDPKDVPVQLGIAEPNCFVAHEEGAIRFAPRTGLEKNQDAEGLEKLWGLDFNWTIKGGNVPVAKEINSREGTLDLKEGLYHGHLEAKDKYGKTYEKDFSFVVDNTDPGNNFFINHSQTPASVLVDEPVGINLSGSYADTDVNCVVTFPEEDVSQTLPYVSAHGARNRMTFAHSFHSVGVKEVGVEMFASGEQSPSMSETFEIRVDREKSSGSGAQAKSSPAVGSSEKVERLPSDRSAAGTMPTAKEPTKTPGCTFFLALGVLLLAAYRTRR